MDQTTISRLENGRLASLRLVRIAALMQALSGNWRIFEESPTAGDAKNGIAAE